MDVAVKAITTAARCESRAFIIFASALEGSYSVGQCYGQALRPTVAVESAGAHFGDVVSLDRMSGFEDGSRLFGSGQLAFSIGNPRLDQDERLVIRTATSSCDFVDGSREMLVETGQGLTRSKFTMSHLRSSPPITISVKSVLSPSREDGGIHRSASSTARSGVNAGYSMPSATSASNPEPAQRISLELSDGGNTGGEGKSEVEVEEVLFEAGLYGPCFILESGAPTKPLAV
ncbi:MAG: hypothetical protein J3R72DRAFT_498858 [Linnemannia gamsii]|nr:MAG: hypothetical protein J3R72DRAFT_498858 [Linnemannia gamsii]